MPIVATPGSGNGVAQGDGVTGTPALWALGRVPLNVAVQPDWQLQNTGSQSTELTFELSMYPGMDGVHDMTVHVPVQYADGSESVLDLAVTNDFRN